MQHAPARAWINKEKAQSREGRDIQLVVSEDNPKLRLDTLILGVFHGDEREAALLASEFLIRYSPADFQGHPVGMIPVLNPDGFARHQRVNAENVDLNRNFPTRDWAPLNEDTIYYSGPSAGSEPETQFVLQLLERYQPQKILTLHTPYKVINFDGPARGLAEAMAAHNGYPVVEDIGYSTPGSFGTYTGKERHIPTITLELPEENFDEQTLNANLAALKAAVFYSMTHH